MKLSIINEVVGHWQPVYGHPGILNKKKRKKKKKTKSSKIADYDSDSIARRQNLSIRIDK